MREDILRPIGSYGKSVAARDLKDSVEPKKIHSHHIVNMGRIRREGFPSPLFQEHTLRLSPQYARARLYLVKGANTAVLVLQSNE